MPFFFLELVADCLEGFHRSKELTKPDFFLFCPVFGGYLEILSFCLLLPLLSRGILLHLKTLLVEWIVALMIYLRNKGSHLWYLQVFMVNWRRIISLRQVSLELLRFRSILIKAISWLGSFLLFILNWIVQLLRGIHTIIYFLFSIFTWDSLELYLFLLLLFWKSVNIFTILRLWFYFMYRRWRLRDLFFYLHYFFLRQIVRKHKVNAGWLLPILHNYPIKLHISQDIVFILFINHLHNPLCLIELFVLSLTGWSLRQHHLRDIMNIFSLQEIAVNKISLIRQIALCMEDNLSD